MSIVGEIIGKIVFNRGIIRNWTIAKTTFIIISVNTEIGVDIGNNLFHYLSFVPANGQFCLTGCYRNQNTATSPAKPTLVIAFRCQRNRSTENGLDRNLALCERTPRTGPRLN